MATYAELMAALRKADAAGDTEAAKAIARQAAGMRRTDLGTPQMTLPVSDAGTPVVAAEPAGPTGFNDQIAALMTPAPKAAPAPQIALPANPMLPTGPTVSEVARSIDFMGSGYLDVLRGGPRLPPEKPVVEPDPFAGEGFLSLAKRRGQQFMRGATEIFATLPEAAAIVGATADRRDILSADYTDAMADKVSGDLQAIEARMAEIEEALGLNGKPRPAIRREDRAAFEEARPGLEAEYLALGEARGQKMAVTGAGGADAMHAEADNERAGGVDPVTGELVPAKDRPMFAYGDKLREASANTFGAPDARDTGFWGKVAEGSGSVAAFATSALVPGGAVAKTVTGAALGSETNMASMYSEATAAGADEETAQRAAKWGALIGAGEIIPINRALKILPRSWGPKVANWVMKGFVEIAESSGEEWAQEWLSQVANNWVAKGLYDPERGWMEGANENALIGAITGGGVGAIGSAMEGRGKTAPEVTKPPEGKGAKSKPSVVDQIAATMAPKAQDAAPVAPAPEQAAPQTAAPDPMAQIGAAMAGNPAEAAAKPMTRAEVEASPDRYDIIDESEGQGHDWKATGRQVVLDKQTGRVSPLAPEQGGSDAKATAAASPTGAENAGTNQADQPAGGDSASQPVVEGRADQIGQPDGPGDVQDVPDAGSPTDKGEALTTAPNQPVNFEFIDAAGVERIGTEPGVMQYKAGGDAEGVTDRLKGVTEWRPERAGMSIIYEYADGRRVIADGHQRLGLAKRLAGQGKKIQMPAMILRQADGVTPQEARVTAALKNIAEGSGTALDAAKVLRDSTETVDQLGLPPSSAIVRDAMGLGSLSDQAFGMVVNGVSSERDGGIVGRVVADKSAQANILALLARMQKDRPITAFQAESVARQAAADTVTETQDSLFGPETDTQNLYLERAKILEAASRMKREEQSAFKNVIANADRLQAAGNQLDADGNQTKLDSAAAMRDYLTREANTKGAISEALTAAARAFNGGATIAAATRQFLDAVERGLEARGGQRPGGDQGGEAIGSQRPPESGDQGVAPEGRDENSAGGDLFDPPQTGKAPAQVKAEDEAKVRSNQSKLRKAGGNDGDAGPLFDPQPDLLSSETPKTRQPESGADLIQKGRAILQRYSADSDAIHNQNSGTDLRDTPEGKALAEGLQAAKSMDAKKKLADTFVVTQGMATGDEYLVVLDGAGVPLAIMRGGANWVSAHAEVFRAADAGTVGYATHNHPRSITFSGADVAVLFAGFSPLTVMGHDGTSHTIEMVPGVRMDWEGMRANGIAQVKPLGEAFSLIRHRIERLTNTSVADMRDISRDKKAAHWARINNHLFPAILDRMGVVRYFDATAVAKVDALGINFEDIYGQVSGDGSDGLRRAGLVIPEGGDRSRDQAAGRGGPAAPSDADRADRKPQGDAGSRPVTTGNADLDGALDDLFGDESDVSGAGNDLERGGRSGASADGLGGTDVSPATGHADQGSRGRGKAPDGGKRKRRPDRGLPDGDAPVVGAGSDPAPDGQGGTDSQPAASGNGGRRNGSRDRRLPSDPGREGNAAGDASGSPARLTPAERLAAIRGILKEDVLDFVAEPALREDPAKPIDPQKADALQAIFLDALQGVNVAQSTDRQLFGHIVLPLREAGMTRDEVAQLAPYLESFLGNLRAGRIGLEPDPPPTPKPIEAGNKAALQAEADKVRVHPADRDNIDATLPLLLPVQRDDVFKVETRFAKPDGHGMLITNGTGTGKTFSGGGVIKRFVQQGKSNVLIVAPSDAVIDGWVKTMDALAVPVQRLANTKDAGQGVVITTYANLRKNNALATRDWDLVVTDESQNLMSNAAGDSTSELEAFRAITHRPDDLHHKSRMLHADDWAKYKAMPNGDAKNAKYRSLKEREAREAQAWLAKPRPKALFLSATPFAYDKTVDYAEGYLFSYPKDGRVNGSNQSGRNLFFVQNFGYRIRYHKLTRPEHAVDSAVFEREFHEKLKREGVLSCRSLQVDVDYDRRFVKKDAADGTRLDEALEALDKLASEERGAQAAVIKAGKIGTRLPQPFNALQAHMRKNFDYLARQQLLEAIKAKLAADEIKANLALGRKVVVFHDFNVGGGLNPFTHLKMQVVGIDPETGDEIRRPVAPMTAEARDGYRMLLAARPWIKDLNFNGYKPPIKALPEAIGKTVRLFNGNVPQKQRLENLAAFNTDGSGVDVLVVQADAGGAGVSMHDVTGRHQRVLINLGMPVKPTTTLQQEGRIRRVGSMTDAIFRYFTIGTTWERTAFAQRIAERSGTVENLALGNEARDLMNAFIDSYMDASDFAPSAADGKGGAAKDARGNTTTPFQRAVSHYFGRPKISGRRDQRDGIDFYPTPEPLAFKMVEWAGLRANERVLEPSAGDGAILRYMPDDVALHFVEPSSDLRATSQLRAPKGVSHETTFENHHISNKYHAIVMNPPFGQGGATAIAHLAKAARHLRDGGRIVALIPTGPSADKRFDAWWEGDDAKGLHMSAEVSLPAVAFERAGTGVMTRVVIIDKPAKGQKVPLDTQRLNFTGATTIQQFFDRLEGYDVRRRPDPVQDVVEELEAEGEDATTPATRKPGPPLATEIGSFKKTTVTSKKGKVFPAAHHADKVDRAIYDQMKAAATALDGWWHKNDAAPKGSGPTFAFRTEAARDAFLADMQKPTAPSSFEETAYHGTPHDFDRFSLDAMGTGEGAQAFGWGLYFAGRRAVSEWYRRTLARRPVAKLRGKPVEDQTGFLANAIKNIGNEMDGGAVSFTVERDIIVADLRDRAARERRVGTEENAKEAEQAANALADISESEISWRGGTLFTVDIPGPENLLDWEARLADQPEAVTDRLRDLLPDLFGGKGDSVWTEEPETAVTHRAWRDQFGWQIIDLSKVYAGGYFNIVSPAGTSIAEKRKLSDAKDAAMSARKHFAKDMRGSDAYRILSAERGGDRAASEALRAAGIPGHRYLDGSSRSVGEGSHNFVIYDDAAIQIIAKEQRAQLVREAAATTEEIQRLMPKLRAELDRLGLKRVKLSAREGAEGWQGAFVVTGDGEMEIVIGASLDPVKTLHHEVIHALRAMNLFTPAEWQALTLAAERNWLAKHDIAARYPHLTAEERIEEAVAEEFSEALAAKQTPKGSILITAFNKIARIFRAVRNVLNGAGYQTPEDIFGRVLAGEVSRRRAGNTGQAMRAGVQGQRGTKIKTDTPAFKRWFGNSKVVWRSEGVAVLSASAEGQPKVVYHGTAADFDAFRGMIWASEKNDYLSNAYASTRAMMNDQRNPKVGGPHGGNVVPLYMRAERPFDADFGLPKTVTIGDMLNAMTEQAEADGRALSEGARKEMLAISETLNKARRREESGPHYARHDFWNDAASLFGQDGAMALQRAFSVLGFDSVKMVEAGEQTWGVFSPTQVKSVFNRGTFDGSDPRISYQRPPLAVRPLTPQARAHRNSAMGATPFIPDRRVWETLTRAGIPIWQRLRDLPGAASDAVDRARYTIQDRMLPFLRAQEAVMRQTGRPLPKEHDAYLTETTFSGKVGRHLLEIDEEYTKPIIQIIAASNGKMDVESVGTWLYARHAIERNAYIASINPNMPDGGSGMLDAEAQQILGDVANSPDAAQYDRIGALIDQLRERNLRLREDAGLISQTDANLWRAQYKHYVPLKGFEETDHYESMMDLRGVATGRRFSMRGAESRRALGRQSEAFNPLQSAITQAQEVAIRAEKNRVAQAMYELAANYPSAALWEVKAPKQKRYFNRTTGLVESRVENPVTMVLEPNEMAVKIDGKEHRILFNDQRLAESAGTLGADQMGAALRVLSMFSRFFSMTRTMLNPEFMITNAFRDFQTAQFNIQAFGEADKARIAKAMAKNWRKAFLGAMRGSTYRFDTEWSRYYREFQKAGAQVWFWTMEQPEAARGDLEKRIELARGTKAQRALKVMTTPSAFFSFRDNAALRFIERLNLAVDNAIRLAAFVEARRAGWDVEKAAFLAKELTVNFNRRGEAGAQMNALYPFFNAAIQGSVRTVKALSSRRVAKMVLAATAAGMLNDLLNAALSDEDDDGELFYDKVANFRNERNFHMVLWGRGDNPVAIPMPYGYNVFPYAGQQLGKVMRGVKKPDEAFADVVKAAFGAFSPISAATPAQMISPAVSDPVVEMAENKNWVGVPIYPQDYGNQTEPDAYVHFKGATEVSKWVAQSVNSLTGGDFRESGVLDVSPETLDHLAAFVAGSAGAFWGRSADIFAKALQGDFESIEQRDVPFLRNLASPVGDWSDRDRFYRFSAEVKNAQADKKAYEAAGITVPKKTGDLAALYEDYLAANRELTGKGDWNPKKPGSLVAREQGKVWLDFNRKYLGVMGKQGE